MIVGDVCCRSRRKPLRRLLESFGERHARLPTEHVGGQRCIDEVRPQVTGAGGPVERLWKRSGLARGRQDSGQVPANHRFKFINVCPKAGPDIEARKSSGADLRHVGREGDHVGPRHIRPIYIVTHIVAVAVDHRRFAREQFLAKDRDDARLTMRILPRAVDVRVAEGDGREAVLTGIKLEVPFADPLRDPVGAHRIGGRRLRSRSRHVAIEHATARGEHDPLAAGLHGGIEHIDTGSPISSCRRGSTGIATTGCLPRITSSGGRSRYWPLGTLVSGATPRSAGRRAMTAPREAAATHMQSPARTTPPGLRGPNSWPGWGRSRRTTQTAANVARRLGRARESPRRPGHLSGTDRRVARDRHPQSLTAAGREVTTKPRGRRTQRDSAPVTEKRHARGEGMRSRNRLLDPGRRGHAAHEPLVSS